MEELGFELQSELKLNQIQDEEVMIQHQTDQLLQNLKTLTNLKKKLKEVRPY